MQEMDWCIIQFMRRQIFVINLDFCLKIGIEILYSFYIDINSINQKYDVPFERHGALSADNSSLKRI